MQLETKESALGSSEMYTPVLSPGEGVPDPGGALSSGVWCGAGGRAGCWAGERANPARITPRVLCPQVHGAALAGETPPSPTPDAVRSCRG